MAAGGGRKEHTHPPWSRETAVLKGGPVRPHGTLSLTVQLATMSGDLSPNINLREPRWDQGTFVGRTKHFFTVTDPRNLLLTDEQLEAARKTVQDYR